MTSLLKVSHQVSKFQQFIRSIPLVFRYGVILALGLILLKTLEYQLFSYRFSLELYTGLLALFFLLVGISAGLGWLYQQPSSMKHSVSKDTSKSEPLSIREHKLLVGLKDGLTNQQLADQQHLSINTIKTHLKSLYRKLNVKNRSQAVTKATELGILKADTNI